ncbi:MAG: DUF4278 domain-containing protein [Oscillatoriaceae bacterium SKW80]|nr:DUF4278 domain-containing protein [Oscillatoriaceae bacterium SKYG93]MCX8119484.1 DUF4278 domain-containing protein [Oscillatoriaceae bacterium SKW80]MDW8454951.1 DUF4278 domain-containing protein [Oscillatoriaceae cyanobacterium SKYGB_i_bin93]HIK28270.1 DUF4278 domain-containing protein [Oscillatoriaceae cyanobacterium M7585_C2015_266]
MAWGLMVPVAIFLLLAYILTNCADEIAYIAAVILLVSLFLSLILAPWQIKWLLLALVLLSNRKISQPKLEQTVEESNEKKLKLSYRGINYEKKPSTMEVTEEEIIGKYRGQIYKSSSLKKPIEFQPLARLKYRGASIKQE